MRAHPTALQPTAPAAPALAPQLEHWRAQTAAGKPVKLHEMAGAGHWIPASHPQELLAAMAGELPALK